ncbi:BTAD domain-containing putative transcriptional regulator [Amycolatopsis suaedae]|uniref:BTAD domain-containing putative transcriptional regulator n=1 Tax=Amycolatopsis suaedae TaxID=2510978 RepID=UPI00196AC9FA|nr:BTAD domain-containing putative transcriptional regulator [Amycolatopsis suaedae]
MRFGVLGPLAVWTSAGVPVEVSATKLRSLLAVLLVRAGRFVPTDLLIEQVWGERLPGNPRATLQNKVWQLRRKLDAAEPGAGDLIGYQQDGYLLRAEPGAVDADLFSTLTGRARATADPRARAALFAEAMALWRGEPYADVGDLECARPVVAQLAEQRIGAVEDHARARLDLGEHVQLAMELADAAARHPLREGLQAVYLLALYRSGRQGEALHAYARLSDRLRGELGTDPGRELVELHRAMLEQSPALDAAPGNLPVPLTELVGRAGDVEAVSALVRTRRVVTLTGTGGVGKTRLALAAADRLRDAFPDGIFLVPLVNVAPGAPVAAVADAVAATLGIRDGIASARTGQATAAADRLVEVVRGRRMLLVLDNCEHVVEAAAELADVLLRSAAGPHVLLTSQEPLRLTGEHVYYAEPLAEPGAVELFVARAAAASPGFALESGNAAAVANICRRLDGIPLALELAATQVRGMGVHQLARGLDDHLLTAGRRGAPRRQRTLRATVDWSWELLSDVERAVLRRLAVHVDGCALAAAEATCAGDDVEPAAVVGLLARLVDRSLVIVTEGPRYRLLAPVTAYCAERLRAAGEFDETRRRHSRYYLELAEEAEPHLRGHGQRQWLRTLDTENANLRAALETFRHEDTAAPVLRLVTALSWYWVLSGRLREGGRALAAAHAHPGPAPHGLRAQASAWHSGIRLMLGEQPAVAVGEIADTEVDAGLARARWFRGAALYSFGDLGASEAEVSRALDMFRSLGDSWGVAAALWTRGFFSVLKGDLATLRRDCERSDELFREAGDRWGRMQATASLAELAELAGDYARAGRWHRDGLRTAEELGLWAEVPAKLVGLGRAAMFTGDFSRARKAFERAERLAAEQSNRFWEILAEENLGSLARREGDLDTARTRLRGALKSYQQIAHEPGVVNTLAELGFTARLRGDAAEATACHVAGFERARDLGNHRSAALALEGLAGAQLAAGHPVRAARLLGTAAALRDSAGAPVPGPHRPDVDRITAAVRDRLGAETFAAESGAGRAQEPGENLPGRATT